LEKIKEKEIFPSASNKNAKTQTPLHYELEIHLKECYGIIEAKLRHHYDHQIKILSHVDSK
jgi:hypothetical protein